MNGEMFGLFGLFGVGCGLYCLYGYYLLKFKHEIKKNILLPKDVNVYKCNDLEGYCKETQLPLLLLGITAILYGGSDLINTYVTPMDEVFMVMFVALIIVLFYFLARIRKCNKKYFGM